ncbi:MAG: hypothetical protein EXQ99_05100 [Alphaproteobacteria bacterium]|nr:hypothetical protein [Alphaproteobacteria bacterium]
MNDSLDPSVAVQLMTVKLDQKRPLLICDADEVLFAFMEGFERFLHGQDYFYVWRSYKLSGNVRRRQGGGTVDDAGVSDLLARFWSAHAEDLLVIPGAPKALAALSIRAQIVILTNVPFEHHRARERSLHRHGMAYPTIANAGPKGPAVGWLKSRIKAPAFFVDDSPHHHKSVAAHAPSVRRLHFVGDPRLAKLLDQAPDSHHRTDDWATARTVIEHELGKAGH